MEQLALVASGIQQQFVASLSPLSYGFKEITGISTRHELPKEQVAIQVESAFGTVCEQKPCQLSHHNTMFDIQRMAAVERSEHVQASGFMVCSIMDLFTIQKQTQIEEMHTLGILISIMSHRNSSLPIVHNELGLLPYCKRGCNHQDVINKTLVAEYMASEIKKYQFVKPSQKTHWQAAWRN